MTNNEQLLELTGEVENIIFRNDSNGYTVMEIISGEDNVVAVGNVTSIGIGEEVRLIGHYTTHHTYGEQFAFEVCEKSIPKTTTAIVKFLSSGVVKGVGPSTAKKLVKLFGEETLDIMENNPQRIAEIKGISKNKAVEMSKSLKQVFGIRKLMTALSKYGISAQQSIKVWNRYGKDVLEILKENPYCLCAEGLNISFEIADRIAQEQNRLPDDVYRIQAGFIHILEHNKNNGHTCLPKDKLINVCCDFLELAEEKVIHVMDKMLTENLLIEDIVKEKVFVFLPEFHRCENYIAQKMTLLLNTPLESIGNIKQMIQQTEKHNHIQYAQLQKTAIETALTKGMLILTGGPGTGKTTTLNAIIHILQDNGQTVFLSAPTGRAAQRMTQITGCEAKTIHRLLEVSWDKDENPFFMRNKTNLLECDALVIDELSMVDVKLFEGLLKALPDNCRLIMVGDCDQLPSVGAGNVLGDLINSGKIPVVQLNEIFRQSMKSLIVTNAHRIVKGEYPIITDTKSDFFFMNRNSISAVVETVAELYTKRLPDTYRYSPLEDIQILCPNRKGQIGTVEINKAIQNTVNPKDTFKREINIGGTVLRVGDKVMQNKNNYNISWTRNNGENGEGVFNGDIGILVSVVNNPVTLQVAYDDKVAVYDGESALELELAYAVTVHKSQGNEFNAVIIPLYNNPPLLLYRNLLYTAVTRAKNMLIIVGNSYTLHRMVENNRKTLRYSALKDFLIREVP